MHIVDTQHPEYAKMATQWKKCRDTSAGREAVIAAGIEYLPALKDQTVEEYNAYKLRANYVNYVWKTIDALKGMLFRKPLAIETASAVEPLLKDVTMDGRSMHIFAQQTAIEVLTSGRTGVLVDYPQANTVGMTAAEAARLNLRPIMSMYKAESIINWKQERIDNEIKLTLLVLTEDATLPGNEYEHKTETHYRVLDLSMMNDLASGKPLRTYRQRVFRINDKKEDEQIGFDIFPQMNSKHLDFIPFIFIGIDDTTPCVEEPPLIDLADVNLTHYRANADYAHGLHFTGLPTAVVSGYTPENAGDKLYIGSASAWVFPDPQAKASFLEFTGQGLQALEKAIDKLEQQMAILGARLLTTEKKAVETAQTAQIHRAGEVSILASIAMTISIGLTEALQIFSEWAGVEDKKAGIELNRDFVPVGMTSQELTALMGAWMSGGISHEVLFQNLQQGEIIASDLTFEEMQAQIGAQPVLAPENNSSNDLTNQQDTSNNKA